jgi:hypothetical protein
MQYEQKIQRRCCRKLETDWKGQLKKGSPYQNGHRVLNDESLGLC